MGRNRWQLSATPGRRTPRIENLALVPASLLPHKATYQRLANQLPTGAVLVVLPVEDTLERRTLQDAAARLRAKGHAIATVSVAEVLAQAGRQRAPRPASVAPVASTAAPPPPEPAAVTRSTPPPATPPFDGGDVPPFTQELRLVRIDAGTAPARFEVWQWQPTLWGGVALVRLRGALGQPPRAQTLLEAETPHQDERITDRVRRRLRAGYRIADWQ